MNLQDKKDFLINFSFTVVIFTIIFFVGKFTFQYLTPFVLASVIAVLMQKPAGFISGKTKLPKGICAAILTAGVYLALAAVIIFLLYRTVIASSQAVDAIPSFLSYISDILSKIEEGFYNNLSGLSDEAVFEISGVINESLENMTLKITNYISSLAAAAAKNAPSFLFSVIVALVASCYISKDYDGLKKFLRGLCSEKIYRNIIKIKLILSESVFSLLKGYVILTGITFLELFLGFWILGIEHSAVLAVLVALIDLLPVLGTGTVLIPWGIVLISMGNSFRGIGLLLIYFITIIIRNFLEPKIIGKQIGINPLFTLFAMFAGLKLMGFWGLLIFPVALIVVIKYYKNEMEEEDSTYYNTLHNI